MPFYWPSCSLNFCLLLFPIPLLSLYGLVFYGWGLRTDKVLIALSQSCIANLFLIIIIIILSLKKKVDSARLRESDVHPISPKTPAPQHQLKDGKKRKGKRVEDYSRDRAA